VTLLLLLDLVVCQLPYQETTRIIILRKPRPHLCPYTSGH